MKAYLPPDVTGPFGAPMGRREYLPADRAAPIELRLERLRINQGGYDSGGAYWGGPSTMWVCRGHGVNDDEVLTRRPRRTNPSCIERNTNMKILFFPVGKNPVVRTVNDKLEVMQALVGGYVETVPVPSNPGLILWCNEDGISLELPLNRIVGPHYIHGPFFITGPEDDDGKLIDLTDAQIEQLLETDFRQPYHRDGGRFGYDSVMYWADEGTK